MSENQEQGVDHGRVLEEACARNASLELHYRPDDGDVVVARARLLGLDDRYLYLDRPETAGTTVTFKQRQKIEGYLLMNDLVRRALCKPVERTTKLQKGSPSLLLFGILPIVHSTCSGSRGLVELLSMNQCAG